MQAHASKLAKDSEVPDNRFKGFDEFMASAKAHAATKTGAEDPAGVETQTEAEDQPYSPSAGVMVEEDADLPDLVSLIGSSGAPGQNEVSACSLSRHRAGHMLLALPLLHCLCPTLPHPDSYLDWFCIALCSYFPHLPSGGLPIPPPLKLLHLQSSKACVYVDITRCTPY